MNIEHITKKIYQRIIELSKALPENEAMPRIEELVHTLTYLKLKEKD